MLVAHRGQAIRVVRPRVFIIAYADKRPLHDRDDRGQHFFPRQPGPREVRSDALPHPRQRRREGEHAVVLCFVARFAPLLVITVLLAPACIATGGLQVAIRHRADPDVCVGGRNREPPNPEQAPLVCDRLPLRVEVFEILPLFLAAVAGLVVAHIAQPRFLGGLFRVGNDGRFGDLLCFGSEFRCGRRHAIRYVRGRLAGCKRLRLRRRGSC